MLSSRRGSVAAFYNTRLGALGSSAQVDARYAFRGEHVGYGVIVRADLNGYSQWVRDRPIADRVQLLSDFSSYVVAVLEVWGGLLYREEGDCLVALFCPHQHPFQWSDVHAFCLKVAERRFGGPSELSAKVTVALDTSLAIFQKAHEQGTAEWSAEGEGFVRAARLEQAVESKARVYYFADDYDHVFHSAAVIAPSGGIYYWECKRESIRVPGLFLSGGWAEVVSLEHLPGGRVQP